MNNNTDNNNQTPMGVPQQGGSMFEPDQGGSDALNQGQFDPNQAPRSFAQDASDAAPFGTPPFGAGDPPPVDHTQAAGFQQPARDPSQQPADSGFAPQQAPPYQQPGQQPSPGYAPQQAPPYQQPGQQPAQGFAPQQAPLYQQPATPDQQPDYSQSGYQQPIGYNQQGQQPYTAPTGGARPAGVQDTRPMSTLAIFSLISGALSVLLSLVGIFSVNIILLIVAILAGGAGIVLGAMANKELSDTSPKQGKNLALAGLICGIVGAGLALLIGVSCYACWACALSSYGTFY